MRFASVCSGILGAELAWEPLGWEPAWCAEIDPFCRRLIAHHRKELPNLGDFTQATPPPGAIDVLGGGTPCQAFSMSGRRGGLDDPRGELSLEFATLAKRVGARWVVWENVPGVLSSGEGRDFGIFLGALANRGYSLAYRVLDACFFGVAQRRRRVWVVGYLGNDWRPPAAVLFERPRVRGASQESGAKRASLAHGFEDDPSESGRLAMTLGASRGQVSGPGAYIAFDASQITHPENRSNPQPGNLCPALAATNRPTVASTSGVRRLTPLERERLQGFPDGWTAIPGGSDCARNTALGNAWPVPVVRWIGSRIDQVEKILRGQQ